MKCTECPDYMTCGRGADLRKKRRRCPKAKEVYIPTNGDDIRSKNDEELAGVACTGCPPGREGSDGCLEPGMTCYDCWLDWLQSPADGGDGDG